MAQAYNPNQRVTFKLFGTAELPPTFGVFRVALMDKQHVQHGRAMSAMHWVTTAPGLVGCPRDLATAFANDYDVMLREAGVHRAPPTGALADSSPAGPVAADGSARNALAATIAIDGPYVASVSSFWPSAVPMKSTSSSSTSRFIHLPRLSKSASSQLKPITDAISSFAR